MLRKKSLSSLFVGLNTNRASHDSEPARSPTSPLDHMVFSNLSNPFAMSPRSPKIDSPRKSWDSDRVGLGLVDTLVDSRSIVFGSQMRGCKAASPEGVLNMSCPSDIDIMHRAPNKSSSLMVGLSISPPVVRSVSGSIPLFLESLSASDIEMSEDYTRITTHGPNPKITHIFGDCVLESHSKACPLVVKCPEKDPVFPSVLGSADFLSSCYSCKKRLGDGEDIYIYRGEKAFCSCACREQEILAEEDGEEEIGADLIMPSSNSSISTITDENSLME